MPESNQSSNLVTELRSDAESYYDLKADADDLGNVTARLEYAAANEIERLRAALLDLYNGTAEYVYLNNLGDPHNTTPMRRAAEVLGVKYPRSLRPADETE